ncbi:hypothetical protein ABWH89_16435 [Hoeflea alexandrii]|uniref:hypothetical protein n=1 Tax=Hoeflea alexandrii TaxID=288436 RepID=UPI0035CF06A4
MLQTDRFTLCLARAMVLFAIAATVSACAGRPKPLEPATPYNVTEVRVMADSIEDLGFAGRLQQRLEATAGRATADVGQTSALRIVVQDRRQDPSPVSFFGGTSQSVELDLTLTDVELGRVLTGRTLRSSYQDFNGAGAEAVMIARLTGEVRALLGLSGYTPYPVAGAKREVAWPRDNPERFDDEALRAVDPLLNGTVTPTTVTLDVEEDPVPAMDFSKPLLDAGQAPKPVPAADRPLASPEPVKVTLDPGSKPLAPSVEMSADDAGTIDEPCIITLENDCSDPDSR